VLFRRSAGRVSVVIPTLNEGALLGMTIDSIRDQTRYQNWEILIVDDGSTDGSIEAFRDADARVRVIDGRGVGVARARNLGARHASGKYLVFIDAHCRVSADWLDALVEALAPMDVGLVGPTFTRLEEPEPRGCGMVWKDATLDPAWFEPADDRPYAVPLTTGACQAFRRRTFEAVGGYEHGFTRWGFEDVEICVRAWLLGYRVVADPRAVVAHYFRESRNYEVNDADITMNFLRMIHMHFTPPRIRRVLRAVAGNPLIPAALDRLYAGDVFRVRTRLEAARVRNDDWFFDRVNGPI
jgi:glycosyltransferase involved in cell wall biosynthesis